MDRWKFYDITHRDHLICNPTSLAKLDELIGLLDLGPEPCALDIASGKGEFIVRVAERFGGPSGAGFRGVAVDISPYCTADLRARAASRIPSAALEILEMDGADYRPASGSFDLASCMGGSWVFGGHRETLRFLSRAVRPGGTVVAGEPFWKKEPAAEYLGWSGLKSDQFGSHLENVEAGEAEGLVPLLALVSSGDEWDRYETLQWRAAARYADAHPDDPDIAELISRVEHGRREYLNWGRDTLGWALYVFATRSRKSGDRAAAAAGADTPAEDESSGTARPHSRALPRDSRRCLDSQFAWPGWPGSAAERLGAGRAESPMRLVRRLPSR